MINSKNFFERHPKKTIGLLIFLGVVISDILLANILMTLDLYAPQKKIEQYYRIKDPIFHHTLKKNISHSDAVWGSMGYTVNTNSLGFKDKSARKVPLKPDGQRIVFIGDSFTEGVGFSHENSFVGIIAKQLKTNNIEVLNAAVSSYSPIIYYRKVKYYIEDVGLKFDQLVLFLDISDIQDELTSYAFDDNGNVIGHPNSKENEPEEIVKRFITEHTILLSNFRIWLRNIKKKSPIKHVRTVQNSLNVYRSEWTYKENVFDDYGRDGVALAKERMNMLKTLLDVNGIKLTLVVYPWPDQIANKDIDSKQVTIWKKWAQNHDANFINLFSYFINDQDPMITLKKYYIVGDIHWNGEGHKLIAEKFLLNFKAL